MKKVLYIGNNLKGNNPTALLLLTNLLKKNKFKVDVYSSKKNKFSRLLEMCWGVIKQSKVDYILIDTYSTFNFYYALVVSQLARIFSIPYIPILHGGNLPNRLNSHPWLSNLIFNYSYLNVAPSNYLKTEFEKNQYHTIFIPNGIELKNYAYKSREKVDPTLLWVRAFDAIYNPLMAIEVLAALKKTYPSASLCMVGPDKDGSLKQCKELAQTLNVQDAIEFTGLLLKTAWIEKATAFDIFINTTNIDNTPVSVIEAMALGLPVISTNVGGMPYLINNHVDGVLVACNDYVQMSKDIAELIENPKNTHLLAQNARKKVAEFDSEVVAEKWKKILT